MTDEWKKFALYADTREIVRLENVNKLKDNGNLLCYDCEQRIMCKGGEGTTMKKHFAHYPGNRCDIYTRDGSGEGQEHKLGKLILKKELEEKKIIEYYDICRDCGLWIGSTIEIEDGDSIVLEGRISEDMNDRRRGDIVIFDKTRKVKWIIEVWHTHKTEKSNRPENCVEFSTRDIFDHRREGKDLINQFYECPTCFSEKERLKEERIQKEKSLEEDERIRMEKKIQEEKTRTENGRVKNDERIQEEKRQEEREMIRIEKEI